MSSTVKTLLLWAIIFVVVILLWNTFQSSKVGPTELTYSEFIDQFDNGAIDEITISGQKMTGRLNPNLSARFAAACGTASHGERRPPLGAETGGGMSVQFAAIPIRALTDTRLGGPDFRLLGTIARYDRFRRNGTGCYVNARKLAQEARIHYKHLGRQTQRLEAFGYITIDASEADKRRKIYSVIYDETEKVTCAGDNLDAVPSRANTAPPLNEKVTTGGDDRPEKVTKPNSQAVDPQAKSAPKRLSEAYLRDPAKPRARDGENGVAACDTEKPTNHARQGDRGGGNSRAQGHFMLPPKGGYQKPTAQRRAPDWKGWAAWIERANGLTSEQAWNWLSAEIDRIAAERGVGITEAGAILDRELKRRRKVAA